MSQRVTDRVLDEIRNRVDIVELVSSRVPLKRVGSTYKACCPFHKEKTPSFHVNPIRRTYHCFGCAAHGDIFKFLMAQDGLPFMDAVRVLAERAGVPLSLETDYAAEERQTLHTIHHELAEFYRRCLLQTPEAAVARQYLTSRKISAEISERFGIGFAPQKSDTLLRWGKKHDFSPEALVSAGLLAPPNNPDRPDDYYDRFRGRLMFPICDTQGRVVAFSGRVLDPKSHPAKYVNSPETPIFQKSRILYALDKARATIVKDPHREAIICEGQIDVIRCHSAGFDTAVASQGTAFTRDHVEILKRYADSVLLVFDGDSAGRKATLRTGSLFLENGIPTRVVALPPGDDPDSIIRDQGADAFRARLQEAVSLTAFQVRILREEERDPDSVDAVSRISKAVLESLAGCTQAVLRTHLLQEASTLLHLPSSAMEEDLETLRQRRAAHPPATHEHAPREFATTPAAPAPQTAKPAAAVEKAPAVPLSAAEHDLCELLIHKGSNPDVMELLDALLPVENLSNPCLIELHAKWCEERRSGVPADLGALMPTASPSQRKLLMRDYSRADSGETTPRDAALDVLSRLWSDWLKAERQTLHENPDAEKQRRCSIIVLHLNALRSPKTGQKDEKTDDPRNSVLLAEMERIRPTAPKNSQPAVASSTKSAPVSVPVVTPAITPVASAEDSAAPMEPPPEAAADDWLMEEPV